MASLISTQLAANALLREHGLAAQGWRFVWDNARKRGGECNYQRKTVSMSKYLVPLWTDEQVKDTLIHEVAHALTPGAKHGAVWARKMRELGHIPARTHNNEVVPGKWVAFCDKCQVECGRRHRLTARMRQGLHNACRTQVRWIDTSMVSV